MRRVLIRAVPNMSSRLLFRTGSRISITGARGPTRARFPALLADSSRGSLRFAKELDEMHAMEMMVASNFVHFPVLFHQMLFPLFVGSEHFEHLRQHSLVQFALGIFDFSQATLALLLFQVEKIQAPEIFTPFCLNFFVLYDIAAILVQHQIEIVVSDRLWVYRKFVFTPYSQLCL